MLQWKNLMGKTSYLIYGGGAHSRVIISILEKIDIKIAGIFDIKNHVKIAKKIPFLGSYDEQINSKCKLAIAIGDNSIRKKISQNIKHPIATIVDPNTNISNDVSIGEGSQIIASSTINVGTIIGKYCIINTNSSIDHDCAISDFAHIAPGVTICGGVSIGNSTLVGAGSTVLPNVTIGDNVIIGAGSLVNKNIPSGKKVLGTPAKVIYNEKK